MTPTDRRYANQASLRQEVSGYVGPKACSVPHCLTCNILRSARTPLLDQYAWYCDWGEERICPLFYARTVGAKLPNAWGLYDMHGNVIEWVQDWHAEYSSESQVDPAGSSVASRRMLRGGSFSSYAHRVRSAARDDVAPDECYRNFGARLVRQEL